MPLTGKLLADFSQFDAAVRKSEAELRGFQAEANRTGAALDRMTAGQALGGLSTSLGQVDRALGAVGVHIGGEIAALGELGAIAGQTATEIGLLATGGAVLATAMASWKIGKAIGEFTGLTQAISDATAKLLGFGDAAGATAAYRADRLTQASKEAGRAVTDLAEAERILAAASKARQAALMTDEQVSERYRQSLASLDAAIQHLTESQRADIRAGQARGQTANQIAEALNLEASAVQGLIDADRKLAEVQKDRDKREKEYREFKNKIAEEEIQRLEKQLQEQAKLEAEYRDFQNFVGERLMEADLARMKATEAANAEHLKVMLGQDAEYLAQSDALTKSIEASGTTGIWTPGMKVPAGGNVWTSGGLGGDSPLPIGGNIWSSVTPQTGPPVNVNVNVNGMLLTNDPSAREALRKVIDGVEIGGLKRSKKLSF